MKWSPSYKSLVGVLVVVTYSTVLLIQSAAAQPAARPDRGLMPGASYSVSDTETISLTNGNLNLSIPLASLPPMAGGKLNLTLHAIYNSKLWNITRRQNQLPPISGCASWVTDTPQLADAGGWRIGGGYQIVIRDARDDFDYFIPNPPPPEDPCFGNLQDQVLLQNRYYRAVLIGPDGSEHELRPMDHTNSAYSGYGSSFLFNHFSATPNTVGSPMRYYSVDGSYLWAVINPSSNPVRWTVYLNDGTKVTQYSDGIQRISDTNGNSIKMFGDGAGGHIQDEQTGREIRITYDPGANNGWGQTQIIYPTVTGVEQTVAINYGYTRVEGIVYPVQDWSPYGGETGGGTMCTKHEVLFSDVYVIRSIVFPATEPGVPPRHFEFSYNSDQKETVTHSVHWACMQAPESYTRQTSKGLGTLSEMITPTGAVVKYTYSRDGNYIYLFNADDIPRETVRKKTVTHDGTTEEWNYDIFEFNACGGTVTGPDGSVITENCEPRDSGYGNYSMSHPKGGLVFRTKNSNRLVVERHWTLMKFNGGNGIATGTYGEVPFNPVVDAEYTTLLEGNPAQPVKMCAKTFQYDFNGNLISQTEYDWFDPTGIPRDAAGVPTGVPAGATVLRVTNNAYHNDSTSAFSTNVYAKRSFSAMPLILNATQQSSVGPGIMQLSYDGQPYGYPPTAGNVTRKSIWNNVANDWIVTENTYGPYGNLATMTDGRGKVTTFGYDNPALGLPNHVTVDPQNGTGTQTITTLFDYHTGLVTSTTDPNGHTANIDYTNQLLGTVDPFGRPGVAIGPVVNVDGVNQRRRTRTFYEDNARTVTILADMRAEGDGVLKSQTITDMLGRPTETRQYESASAFIAVQKSYDIPNRLSRTSNPFRAGETVLWTTTANDVLGRVVSVTTPDSAVVSTSYYANAVTAIDQAGKQRQSVTDALGRLIQVIEDPNGLNYLTSYAYDALDNLTTVNQGSQTRTFAYDSLKRLTSATNPESGPVCYGAVVNQQCQNNGYDNNGNLVLKTDARGVRTNYIYDALNRLTSRSHENDPAGTPTATYTYDTATNGKGRMTSVSSSVSTYSYSGYDAMGRSLGATQVIGAQNYSMSYTYDLAGHVRTTTYPSGRAVTYNYDGAGRLGDKDAQNLAFTGTLGDGVLRTYASGISYSPFGGISREQYGTQTALYHKTFYNIRGQMFDTRVSSVNDTWDWNRGRLILYYSSNHLWGQSGTDNNGNVRFAEHWIPPPNATLDQAQYLIEDSYNYDALNRLTSVSESTLDIAGGGNWTPRFAQVFNYDRYGNRTINNAATWGAGINNTAFDNNEAHATNRLYAPGDTSLPMNQRQMQFDAAGNLTYDAYLGQGSRSYDAENRMTAAVISGSSATYAYDGDGRRVKRIVGSTETWQVYGAGGDLLAEYAANAGPGSPQKEYGHRNGALLITATVTNGWGAPPTLADNPLVVAQTEVKAQHITQLRSAINALRSHMSLPAFSWQHSATTNDFISANPILEMRTALDQALGVGSYSPGLAQNQPVKAIHIQELRDRVLAAWQSGGGVDIRWLVSDHLGTPRMIFDQTGSLANISRHDYLPFGEELYAGVGGRTTSQGYSAGDGIRQHLTQKERDQETGLDYFLTRYYSSLQGRFTSFDPIFVTAKRIVDPQRLNLYSYGRNNPLKFIDPDGMDIIITAKNEEEARRRFAIFLLGIDPADRKYVTFFVGNGKNGYVKGAFYILVDKNHRSSSENFQAAQRAANDRSAIGRITVIRNGDTYTFRYFTSDPKKSLRAGKPVMYLQTMSGKFNNDFEGYTFFQYRGSDTGEMLSRGRHTEAYINGELDDIEVSATMHHELRAHVLLGDFGRNVPRARHSDAYARGQGEPTTEADKVGERAETEARQNARKKP